MLLEYVLAGGLVVAVLDDPLLTEPAYDELPSSKPNTSFHLLPEF